MRVTKKSWQIRGLRQLRVVWVLMVLAAVVPAAAPLAAQQAPGEQTPNQQPVAQPAQQPGQPPEQQSVQQPVQQPVQQSDPQANGSISGTVVDLTGAIIVGAQVRLTRGDPSASQDRLTDDQGQYSFANIAPGPFQLEISFTDLATQVISGTVKPGEAYVVPQVEMVVATQTTQVTVSLTQVELAEVQIKEQEQQRVLGIIPNFYVTYAANPVPLSPKQKFELAWRSSFDPFTFVAVGAIAGIPAGRRRAERIRARSARVCQALRCIVRRRGDRHVHRERGTACAVETRPALFLQGNGQQEITNFLRAGQSFYVQGRQREMAAELFLCDRKFRRSGNRELLLPRERSGSLDRG